MVFAIEIEARTILVIYERILTCEMSFSSACKMLLCSFLTCIYNQLFWYALPSLLLSISTFTPLLFLLGMTVRRTHLTAHFTHTSWAHITVSWSWTIALGSQSCAALLNVSRINSALPEPSASSTVFNTFCFIWNTSWWRIWHAEVQSYQWARLSSYKK